MLAIRLQRIGRKAYPVYRVAVQESQRHPSSGRVVAYVGSYNPHTKAVKLDTEKLSFYLKNGARPTPRIVRILDQEKIEVPSWVKRFEGKKQSSIKHTEKLRKNQPAPEVEPEPQAEPAAEIEVPKSDEPAASEEPATPETDAPAKEASK